MLMDQHCFCFVYLDVVLCVAEYNIFSVHCIRACACAFEGVTYVCY